MGAYPLDPVGTTWRNAFTSLPFPAYPYNDSALRAVVPPSLHDWSLPLAVPVTFAIAYYSIAHFANHFSTGHDYSRGNGLLARSLRAFVVLHNAGLCIYSFLTFMLTAPVAIDLFVQGYRAAGPQGVQLALCSIPTNTPLLGRWVYLFYLSKYYEVVDSVILYLKGKKIGNLQSYHHAGALFSMWIAYRFQAPPVWVFCAFNSGVHTLMYAYYFSASLKLPFPKTLKRNLTTLQILQIFSGTVLVNFYYLFELQPAKLLAALTAKNIHSSLPSYIWGTGSSDAGRAVASTSTFASTLAKTLLRVTSPSTVLAARHDSDPLLNLSTYARARSTYAAGMSGSCIETTGVALAILGNTLYMGPLLVLFARFYVRSYFAKSAPTPAQPTRKGAAAAVHTSSSNGHAKSSNGHGASNGKRR